MIVLQEGNGYPRADNGCILHGAWQIVATYGRTIQKRTKMEKSRVIFTELCGEPEATIESNKKANYTTQGYTVSGEQAVLAIDSNYNLAIPQNLFLKCIRIT